MENACLPEAMVSFGAPFQLTKYPVTNGQFRRFWEAGGYRDASFWDPEGWRWREKENVVEPAYWRDVKWNGPTQPVVGVSWWEADAFCRWAGCRLPTEREWEAAARGPQGWAYPWGDDWRERSCNSGETDLGVTTPVGIFPQSAAICGAHDLAGNVWEWCSDTFEPSKSDNPEAGRVLRGGSWLNGPRVCRSAATIVPASATTATVFVWRELRLWKSCCFVAFLLYPLSLSPRSGARFFYPLGVAGMKRQQELTVISKCYDLVLWTVNHTSRFPRQHRHVLGDRIEQHLYGVLETLVDGKYTSNRRDLLNDVNRRLEKLRFLYRLAKDLKCLEVTSYGFGAKSVDEIGRLVARVGGIAMKRVGHLWPRMISFPSLARAAERARRLKRSREDVQHFEFDLERNLWQLHDELSAKSYRSGPYHTFTIFEPKRRLISAAPYRDRVVHHALTATLERIFEPTFVDDSFACRKFKGTHAAVDRAQHYARRFRYVLKADIRAFFPSIDHAILTNLIGRKIKDPEVMWLTRTIIDAADAPDLLMEWFPGDDLFTPTERRRGLPIGNQTSQFFANVYLNPLDHFVREQLGAGGYLRYVDDFLMFDNDKQRLARWRDDIRRYLQRLRLHPRKSEVFPVAEGVRFLGYRVFPWRRTVAKENVRRFRRRVRRMQAEYANGRLSVDEIRTRLVSWLGHARQGSAALWRDALFATIGFRKGDGR